MARLPAKDKLLSKLYSNGYVYDRDGIAYLNITIEGNRIREKTPYKFTKENFNLIKHHLDKRIEYYLKPSSQTVTIYHLLEQYLKNKTLSETTTKLYFFAVSKFFPKDLVFDAKLIRRIVVNAEHKISSKSLNRYLTIISAVFNFAKDSDLITENPIKRNFYQKEEKKEIVLPTLEKITTIIEKFKHNPKIYNLLYIMRWSGLRITEAVNLTENNVKDGMIEVIGKGNRKRRIPIFDELKPYLDGYFEHLPNNPKAHVFNVIQQLEKLNFNSHQLRKFRENELLIKGHNVLAVAQILGHTVATQQKHYIALMQNDQLKNEFVSNQ